MATSTNSLRKTGNSMGGSFSDLFKKKKRKPFQTPEEFAAEQLKPELGFSGSTTLVGRDAMKLPYQK